MSRKQKLQDRFCQVPPPTDFRWEELCKLLGGFGFDFDASSGGSHGHFVCRNNQDLVIDISKPHPKGILLRYQILNVREKLREWGMLSE